MLGKLPVGIAILLWSIFYARKVLPDQPSIDITSGVSNKRDGGKLSSFTDKAGIVIFFVTIIYLELCFS